jgi:hypothetical protein
MKMHFYFFYRNRKRNRNKTFYFKNKKTPFIEIHMKPGISERKKKIFQCDTRLAKRKTCDSQKSEKSHEIKSNN